MCRDDDKEEAEDMELAHNQGYPSNKMKNYHSSHIWSMEISSIVIVTIKISEIKSSILVVYNFY